MSDFFFFIYYGYSSGFLLARQISDQAPFRYAEGLSYLCDSEIVPVHLTLRQVMAVDKRELDKWPDVVIVSIKGKRSVASLLADGGMNI